MVHKIAPMAYGTIRVSIHSSLRRGKGWAAIISKHCHGTRRVWKSRPASVITSQSGAGNAGSEIEADGDYALVAACRPLHLCLDL